MAAYFKLHISIGGKNIQLSVCKHGVEPHDNYTFSIETVRPIVNKRFSEEKGMVRFLKQESITKSQFEREATKIDIEKEEKPRQQTSK